MGHEAGGSEVGAGPFGASVSDVEAGFLEKLRRRPNDEDARAIYADWLEEHGRATESELLRLQVRLKKMSSTPTLHRENAGVFEVESARLRALVREVDPTWRRLVAFAPIEGCTVRFDFDCPRTWDSLAPTEDERVRFCDACRKTVHYSVSVEEAAEHARSGRCVVVDPIALRRPNDLAPIPSSPPPVPLGGVMVPESHPLVLPEAPIEEKRSLFDRIKALFG